jgi:hypothetical protein
LKRTIVREEFNQRQQEARYSEISEINEYNNLFDLNSYRILSSISQIYFVGR